MVLQELSCKCKVNIFKAIDILGMAGPKQNFSVAVQIYCTITRHPQL
jgi:hypothetical protein